jgi:hypothetical protein
MCIAIDESGFLSVEMEESDIVGGERGLLYRDLRNPARPLT